MIAGALVIVRGEHETRSLCFPFQLPNVDEINHGALRQSLGMALEIPARLVSAESGEVRLLRGLGMMALSKAAGYRYTQKGRRLM
jgi:hypothetical protein